MALGIIRDALSGKEFTAWQGARMYLYTESGKASFTFPFAPRSIEYGGLAQDWVETERAGREPLLLRKGDNLKSIRFSFMLTDKKLLHFQQTDAFNALETLSKSRERVLVRYGPTEAGLWRITEASVSSELRHPETNEITRATVNLTLTRASDPNVAIGPVTGGTAPAPAAPTPSPPRTHTVKKGDCLWLLAQKYYGKGTLWPKIYDANRSKIKNPHWIYPGQVFVIP